MKQQSNLWGELLFKGSSKDRILLRLAHDLDGHLPTLVFAMIDPTMATGGELIPDEQLWHVGTPLLLPANFDLSTRRNQVHRPRRGPLVLTKRKPPLHSTNPSWFPPEAIPDLLHLLESELYFESQSKQAKKSVLLWENQGNKSKNATNTHQFTYIPQIPPTIKHKVAPSATANKINPKRRHPYYTRFRRTLFNLNPACT